MLTTGVSPPCDWNTPRTVLHGLETIVNTPGRTNSRTCVLQHALVLSKPHDPLVAQEADDAINGSSLVN